MHYLPTISDEDLKKFLLEPDSGFLAEILNGEYERIGIDRALMIAADLLVRTGRCDGYSLLDVGCNTGLIGRAVGALGNEVHGIDNYAVDSQAMYGNLQNVEKCDFLEYLRNNPASWDVVLLLSVAHHWETGYAMQGDALYTKEEIHWIFAELKKRTSVGIYMEMPLNEPGFTADFTDRFVKEYCGEFDVIEINRTVGTNGFMRRMFFLGSAPLAGNTLLEKILRNAHLYEKFEMERLTVPRGRHFQVASALQQLQNDHK